LIHLTLDDRLTHEVTQILLCSRVVALSFGR
jgi:hypothetical protein